MPPGRWKTTTMPVRYVEQPACRQGSHGDGGGLSGKRRQIAAGGKAHMPDKYSSFPALASAESKDAYQIVVADRGSEVVVAAPHGGKIEPGTSEIARAIAGTALSFYLFEGRRRSGNRLLHITSSRFDEPQCLALLGRAKTVLTVHGEDSEKEVLYVGGRDVAAIERIRKALANASISIQQHSNPHLQGHDGRNICNVGSSGAGVQLEFSRGLRKALLTSGLASGTAPLHGIAQLIRNSISLD